MLEIKLKKRPYKGLFLLPIILCSLLNGGGYYPIISSIEFYGNTKTMDFVIVREIQHSLNVPLDSIIAEADRDRLDNLGIFSEVSWRVVPLEDDTGILSFIITESIQKTPPGALPAYDEKTGWSLTGGWIIQNFRGRNQTLQLGGSIGGQDTYGINFADPWMFGNHVSLSLGIGRSLFRHNFLDRELDVGSFQMTFGRWFGESIKSSLGFELEEKSFSNDNTVSDYYYYFSPQVSINYDTRNVYWNPGKGVLVSHYFYFMNGIEPSNYSFLVWRQSYSLFFKLNQSEKKLVLALNGTVKRKWGKKEEVWLNYFGDSYTVRGWALPNQKLYNSRDESFRFGHESAYASVELRKDIIPKYATKYGTEFGLSLVAFYDVGMIAEDWINLQNMKPMSGTGFGIRIPIPMIDAIRIDLGWGYRDGKWNSPTLHWGIQQKF